MRKCSRVWNALYKPNSEWARIENFLNFSHFTTAFFHFFSISLLLSTIVLYVGDFKFYSGLVTCLLRKGLSTPLFLQGMNKLYRISNPDVSVFARRYFTLYRTLAKISMSFFEGDILVIKNKQTNKQKILHTSPYT